MEYKSEYLTKNNANTNAPKIPINYNIDFNIDDFKKVLDINLIGKVMCTKYAYPIMNDGGAIVNISSHLGFGNSLIDNILYGYFESILSCLLENSSPFSKFRRIFWNFIISPKRPGENGSDPAIFPIYRADQIRRSPTETDFLFFFPSQMCYTLFNISHL